MQDVWINMQIPMELPIFQVSSSQHSTPFVFGEVERENPVQIQAP